MRFTAGVSAAQQELWMGLVATVLTFAVGIPLILSGRSTAGWVLLAVGALLATLLLQQGMRRLHRTLRQRNTASRPEEGLGSFIPVQERTALPPQPLSVTEGTTKLVDSARPRAAATVVKDTDAVE
jgi:membrane protein implicated in regulation of membrane protease activity